MGGKYQRPFEDMTDAIRNMIKQIQLETDVSVTESEDGVAIKSRGTLFFDSGSATLSPAASDLIDRLSEILVREAKGMKIYVEGHTDDNPISTAQYPSNWELSSARAGAIVRVLETKGFDRVRLRPLGLADTESLVPNRTPSGEAIPLNQAENRRILIRIQKDLSASNKPSP